MHADIPQSNLTNHNIFLVVTKYTYSFILGFLFFAPPLLAHATSDPGEQVSKDFSNSTVEPHNVTSRDSETDILDQRSSKAASRPLPKMDFQTCKIQYPKIAADYGLEGSVRAKLTVGADGKLKSIALQNSSGWKILDRATAHAYAYCRFTAAIDNGTSVEASMVISNEWKLDPDEGFVKIRPASLFKENCPPSTQFSTVQGGGQKGMMRVLFFLDAQGKPDRTIIETPGLDANVDASAIAYVNSCRYAINDSSDGSLTGPTYVWLRVNDASK
jgi:TonB family protein